MLGVVAPGVLGPTVASGLPVGCVVGVLEGVVAGVVALGVGTVGVLALGSEVGAVEGALLGDWLCDPDELADDESGFCEGVEPSCVPLPLGYCGAGWSCEPPLWPGSNTLL